MGGIATKEVTLRDILDNLVFDPEHTIVDKRHLIPRCEKTILETYDRVVRKTGRLNFDELCIEIIQKNYEILNFALAYVEQTNHIDDPDVDLYFCDTEKWLKQLERAEVSAYVPLSHFIAKVLSVHNRAFIPYMEERYENHCAQAFGVQGIIVVNDCQNILFPGLTESESIQNVDLGNLERVQIQRSCVSNLLCEKSA